jgi:hypothetical protein
MASVNITSVISNASGQSLPVTGNFTCGGGLVCLTMSGSAWRPSPGLIYVMISVQNSAGDGPELYAQVYTNEATSHKALIPIDVVLPDLAADTYTVTINPVGDTVIDLNDYFNVTVTEYAD